MRWMLLLPLALLGGSLLSGCNSAIDQPRVVCVRSDGAYRNYTCYQHEIQCISPLKLTTAADGALTCKLVEEKT